MTCSDVERVLPELLAGDPDGLLHSGDGGIQADFDAHVKTCPACSDLVLDLKLIASEARQLAASEEPAPRVWVRIAAELRAEGLISDPASSDSARDEFARPIVFPASARRRWGAWWLAPVAAALLAASAYVVSHKPVSQVAKQQTATVPTTSPAAAASPVAEAVAVTPTPVPAQVPRPEAKQPAKPMVAAAQTAEPAPNSPAPNAEDRQFLSVVSTLSPSMRVTYENQLQAVNADIRETQAYVNRNPGDADARQHLMDAYQEKALLYQLALDRIQ